MVAPEPIAGAFEAENVGVMHNTGANTDTDL